MGEHTDKIKGKAKEVASDLIDDDELHAEGETDVAAGNANGAVDNIAGRHHGTWLASLACCSI